MEGVEVRFATMWRSGGAPPMPNMEKTVAYAGSEEEEEITKELASPMPKLEEKEMEVNAGKERLATVWRSGGAPPMPHMEKEMGAFDGSKEEERTKACAHLMLKNPRLDDEKEAEVNAGPKEGAKRQRMSFDEMQEYFASLSYHPKRKKKVTVRVDKEYVELLKRNPPPEPFEPVYEPHCFLRHFFDSTIAERKAALDEHERIIKQYEDHGYAEIQFEVTDDEEEEEV